MNFIFNKIICVYRMTNGRGGRDPTWRYCAPLEGHKNGTICNYCGLSIKSGGITRLKCKTREIPNSGKRAKSQFWLKKSEIYSLDFG